MPYNPSTAPGGPRAEHTFQGPRDLTSTAYRAFLISRHGLERNEIVGRYIFDRRTFDTLEQALDAAHAYELMLCAQAAPSLAGSDPVAVFDPSTGTARVYASRAEARLMPE